MLSRIATPEERTEALRFLRENIFAAVATVSAEQRPQVAFMYYAVDPDFTVFVMTKRDSRKCRNLLESGFAALAIGNELGLESVQLEGAAKEITDGAETARRAESIFRSPRLMSMYMGKQRLKFLPSMNPTADPVKNALFAIKPDWLRLLRVNPKTGDSEFVTIIS